MSLSCFFTLSFLILFVCAQGVVPPSQTFNFVNEGEFGEYIVEYDANYRVLSVFSTPFQLCFYNTTPGAYTLALRMGTVRSESLMRWVWEANRGNPVGENATFSLGTNGNLVLADADGRVAWQSNTADKGVVGFRLLPNGNMVLYDSNGRFVWQSFDSPTDTLLVGQALRLKGPNKLVSRLSETENKDGAYSLVLEPNRFVLYYASKNSPRPMLYFDATDYLSLGKLDVLTFNSQPDTDDAFAYEITLENSNGGTRILSRPKYNSTLTYLRLGIDGGLRAYTFYDKVDWGAWEETFTLFPRDSGEECQLPERCGSFGLCEDSQCVACPSPNGLLGWSKSCAPPKLTSCKPNDIKYYKLEGVDHFMSKYTRGSGPVKEEDCSRKCTSDCKCLGFFFNRAESRCWIAYELKTLTRVGNSTHLGYIKAPAH
ncbi:UNVERIFIED_CONTAM: EP1-like glycoprotein 4 [Sesamum radiatum]|uniref:EP1-like glycoprotein 4 n=1 Tax=Sesamum radiatum TaxID=300843 RepID=A0AAW2KJV1_SESRA